MVFSENNRVFVWKDFKEWKPALEAMFPDILTLELEAKVKKNVAIVEDLNEPGPEAFETLSGHSICSMVELEEVEQFRRLYSHIRVFHGCRTIDVQNYYRKGLLLLNKQEQIDRFRPLFLKGNYPALTEEMLQQSIQEVATMKKYPEDEIYLPFDDKWIIEQCGHYLIYGSEYFSGLVSQLPDKELYLSVLRQIGKPTMIEINLPNASEYDVTCDHLSDITYYMLTNWVRNIAHSRKESGALDFTFTIEKPLPPEHICGHYHPPRIPDPYMGYKIYNTETGEYEDAD